MNRQARMIARNEAGVARLTQQRRTIEAGCHVCSNTDRYDETGTVMERKNGLGDVLHHWHEGAAPRG